MFISDRLNFRKVVLPEQNLEERGAKVLMSIKVCAGIVTYECDLNDLLTCMQAIANQVSSVIVVDNGSSNVDEVEHTLAKYKNVIFEKNNSNAGIAKALNQIFEAAISEKYDWVLTLDDDSTPPSDIVARYLSVLAERENVNARTGIIAPLLISKTTGIVSHSKTDQDRCITSGSLTNIDAWRRVGGFDEWLFIDEVDYDFSARIFKAGYEIIENTSVKLLHKVGDSKSERFLFWHRATGNYPPLRKYYQMRNRIVVDYKLRRYSVFKIFGLLILRIISTILFEDKKRKKISALFKGTKDGLIKIRDM